MSAKTDLLPLPEMVEVDKHLPTGVSIYAYDANTLKDYARANLAELQREVERVTCELMDAITRADKLAEALALLPDDSGMVEHSPEEGPFMFCCGREVTYDRLHGPICTHDEDCWYARMRALRDRYQEDHSDC